MANVNEAKARYREAQRKVETHRMYEGRSTKSGNELYQDAYDAAYYYINALEEYQAIRENAYDIPVDIIRCPVHGIPDCSPLLNGCSIPNRLAKAYLAGKEK